MLTVVTACDDRYAEGVAALWSSIRTNAPNTVDLWCLAYGDKMLYQDLEEIGIKVIDKWNASFPEGTRFPIGGMWKGYSWEAMAAMYSRVLVPKIFDVQDRVLWLDADTLVLDDINELLDFEMHGHLTAQPIARRRSRFGDFPSFNSGVMLFDVEAWNAEDTTDKMIHLMNNWDGPEPGGVVETLLNFHFAGNIEELPVHYHWNAKRKRLRSDTKIAHFPCCRPWDADDMATKPPHYRKLVEEVWEPYRWTS